MSNLNISTTHVLSISMQELTESKLHQTIFITVLFALILLVSTTVFADKFTMSSAVVEPVSLDENRPDLIDWAAKMGDVIQHKIDNKLQIIIIQAEESRLLENQTQQFAGKENLAVQPAIGTSEPNFLTREFQLLE